MKNLEVLIKNYMPITANPNRKSKEHTEMIPCAGLRPYIRCFWGTTEPICKDSEIRQSELVIPDTCMDIIFVIDYENNKFDISFCAIDETGYYADPACDTSLYSIFAIRFYAWSAALFANQSFYGSKNGVFEADAFFADLKSDMLPMLMDVTDLKQRSEFASRYLMKRLNPEHINHHMLNAVYDIVRTMGRISIAELAKKNVISKRQLERIFGEYMGISPKCFSNLVRYQMIWQEMYYRSSNILDLALKYGYYDQAHLQNDFKKRHTMTPKHALKIIKD